MIIIPSMPTRPRPLPHLEIHLEAHELRTLAFALDSVVSPESWTGGLCLNVELILFTLTLDVNKIIFEFGLAIHHGMNQSKRNGNSHTYLYSYLEPERLANPLTVKELAAIRTAWARHIARSIYEQIGD